MDVFIVANSPAIKQITVNANYLDDGDPDLLYISNPNETPLPLCFWNPDKIALTFNGAPFGSLQLPPKSLCKLRVSDGAIVVEKESGGPVLPIPLVPAIELNPINVWNFRAPYVPGVTKFNIPEMRKIHKAELAKLKGL